MGDVYECGVGHGAVDGEHVLCCGARHVELDGAAAGEFSDSVVRIRWVGETGKIENSRNLQFGIGQAAGNRRHAICSDIKNFHARDRRQIDAGRPGDTKRVLAPAAEFNGAGNRAARQDQDVVAAAERDGPRDRRSRAHGDHGIAVGLLNRQLAGHADSGAALKREVGLRARRTLDLDCGIGAAASDGARQRDGDAPRSVVLDEDRVPPVGSGRNARRRHRRGAIAAEGEVESVRRPGSFRRNVPRSNHDAAIGGRAGLDENAVLHAIAHSAGHRAARRDRNGAVAVLFGVDPVPAGLHRADHADADAARAVALAGLHAVMRRLRTRLHVAANLNGDIAGGAVAREHAYSALALDVPGRGNRQRRVGAAVDADPPAAAAGTVHGDRHGGSGGVVVLDVDGMLARSGAFDGPCRRHRDAARALLIHPYAVLAARNGRRLDRHAPARSVAVDRNGRRGGLHLLTVGDIAAHRRFECPAAHGNRSAAGIGQVDPVGPPGDAARRRDGDRAGAGIVDEHAASA